LVILLAPRRALLGLVLAAITVAPVFRGLALAAGWNDMAVLGLPFASLDALGLGALLALLHGAPALNRWLGRLAVAAVLLAPIVASLGEDFPAIAGAAFDLVAALPLVWLVDRAVHGFDGPFGRLLSHPAPVYLGQISYGLYLFHPFVKWAVASAAERTGWFTLPEGMMALLVLTALSIAVAALSWHGFERPLNALKKRIPYAPMAKESGLRLGAAASAKVS
jgi:peptidoglycan/LPS O-acetylase OafA/YrhL